MHRRLRQLAGLQAAPGVAVVAIDDRLQINPTYSFERTHHEGVHGHHIACMVSFDVPVGELRSNWGLLQNRSSVASLKNRNMFFMNKNYNLRQLASNKCTFILRTSH